MVITSTSGLTDANTHGLYTRCHTLLSIIATRSCAVSFSQTLKLSLSATPPRNEVII